MEGRPQDRTPPSFLPVVTPSFAVRTFIEDTCARAAIQHDDCLRLTLLIEELFANTVGSRTRRGLRRAGPPRADHDACGDRRRVRGHRAPAQPVRVGHRPTDAEGLDDRRVGGLGITLISAMAEDVGYDSRDGCNQIRFRLPLAE